MQGRWLINNPYVPFLRNVFKELILSEYYNYNCLWLINSESKVCISGIEESDNWDELRFFFYCLTRLATVSLFSLWDIEFCSQYFSRYEQRPIFSLVLPRENPKFSGKIEKRRDSVWLPVRRLIDILACIFEYLQNNNWPNKIPSVKEYSKNVGMGEAKIKKWRNGDHYFTQRDFFYLWVEAFKKNNKYPYKAPTPLFVATIFWVIYFVNKEDKRTNPTGIEKSYFDYFEWHKNKYEIAPSSSKKKQWPSCFDMI